MLYYACQIAGVMSRNDAAIAAIEDYVADPRGTTFHKAEPRCLFVDPSREMLRYHGRKAAEDSGRTACQHCLNGPAVGQGLTSTLSRPRLPTGTQ